MSWQFNFVTNKIWNFDFEIEIRIKQWNKKGPSYDEHNYSKHTHIYLIT